MSLVCSFSGLSTTPLHMLKGTWAVLMFFFSCCYDKMSNQKQFVLAHSSRGEACHVEESMEIGVDSAAHTVLCQEVGGTRL